MTKKKSELDLFTNKLIENTDNRLNTLINDTISNSSNEIDEFENYPILGKVLKLFGLL